MSMRSNLAAATVLATLLALPQLASAQGRVSVDINTASMVFLLVMMPAAAAVSDRVGRGPVLLAGALGTLLLAWPLFRLMHHHDAGYVLLAQCLFAVVLGMFLGVVPVVLAEAFPRHQRCSGFALGYNLGLAVFGGLSPMVTTYLIARTQDDMMPAYVVGAAALLTLAAIATLRETARGPLD